MRMRKWSFPAILMLLVLAAAPVMAQHQSGTITGLVTDQTTGQPLAMAMVHAFAVNDPTRPFVGTMTDNTGRYTLRLPYGRYLVMANKWGFAPEWWQEAAEPSQATPVVVSDSVNPTGINFTLSPPTPPPTGTISGTVTNQANGSPIFRAMVKAFGPNNVMFTMQTDSSGNYQLTVPYGRYLVMAEKMGFAPEWWQEAARREDADPVMVDDTLNPTGINFTLAVPTNPQAGSIAGTITDAVSSQPIAGAMVKAEMYRNHHFYRVVHSGPDGNYIFNDLPAGTYRVAAMKEGYAPANYPDSIVINGNNVTGINIALQPIIMGLLTGVVTDAATDDPIVGAMIRATNMNVPRMYFQGRTDSTGAYAIGLPVGVYHVEAFARDYYPGSADSVVVGDLAPTVLDFALAAIDFGSISGTVYDSANTPIFGAFVEARMIAGYWRGMARTDSSGNYTIANVIPGNYIVSAHARGFNPAVYPETVGVDDGEDVTGIDFHLLTFTPPDGMISGLVTSDSTGDPVGGALVVAMGTDQNAPHRWRDVRFTRTAEDGTYAFNRLRNIAYKIFCSARGYLGEFYDDKPTWQTADPVTPNASGINFGLANRSGRPRFVGGLVYEGNRPHSGALVMLLDNDGIVDIALTMPDGAYEFAGVEPGNYTVRAIGMNENQGEQALSVMFDDIYGADVVLSPTGIDDGVNLPQSISLMQNYPNPFNASTNIKFSLPKESAVDLAVYDLLGRRVATLASGVKSAGEHTVTWNGDGLASGLYLYILRADGVKLSHRMLLLK